MYPIDGKNEIMHRLSEIETNLEETKYSKINFQRWIKLIDQEISQLLNGLKTICFDCGEIRNYSKYEDEIVHYWNKIQKNYGGINE